MRICDEFEHGFGWILEDELPRRTSHALSVDGAVWLVDPVDAPGVEERVRALGEARGVIQLIDRHSRDCEELARRYAVPWFQVPLQPLPASPFEFVTVAQRPFWREVALWWPEARVLACGDALGTVEYFLAPGEPLAVHRFLRVKPPRELARLEPEHILCGHGEGVHGPDAVAALREAFAIARRRLPLAYVSRLAAVTRL